nr:polyadenylate-binding protein 7-like [Ziziphus jujuba var. spinosa]
MKMKMMWSERNPVAGRRGIRSLSVINLDLLITNGDMFRNLGIILPCKVRGEDGKSKGLGFIELDSEKSDNTVFIWKKIYVSKLAITRIEAREEPSFTNLYLEAEDMTKDLLPESRAFGFVNFGLPAEALDAVEVLNSSLEGTARAQKKDERMEPLKH